MANIFDMAKKAANKISDEVNKNKWDHNSINSALFSNDSELGKFPANPSAAQTTFQQPNTAASGGMAGTAAPVPATNASVAPTPVPVQNPTMLNNGSVQVQAASSTAPTPVQPTTSTPTPAATQPQGYTKPVFRSRFAGPVKSSQPASSNSLATLPTVDASQKISNIGNENVPGQAAPVQSAPAVDATAQVPVQQAPYQAQPAVGQPVPLQQAAPAPNPLVQPVQNAIPVNGYCYYVQIKHTKSYPAPKSIVMMRSCDHEYVWTDQQSETAKPNYPVCPSCGKTISQVTTEMDD